MNLYGIPQNMMRLGVGKTDFSYAASYSDPRKKDVIRVGYWDSKKMGYTVYRPTKTPIHKTLLQRMHIQDLRYTHCRITRSVWDAIVLYTQLEAKDENPYAGLTLNQFIFKMVPKHLRYPGKRNGKSY